MHEAVRRQWLLPLLVVASSGDTNSRGFGRAFLNKTGHVLYS